MTKIERGPMTQTERRSNEGAEPRALEKGDKDGWHGQRGAIRESKVGEEWEVRSASRK